MRPTSYIGFTGASHQHQSQSVVRLLRNYPNRLVMEGMLVSNRTLRGETNRWPNRYPKPEEYKNIFIQHDSLLNLIHFNTSEPADLLDDMCRAQDLAGPNCDGFQLNVAWPDPKVLEAYKTKAQFRRKVVVLQCGNQAIKETRSPFDVGLRLRPYDGLIDYVLVDKSEGNSKDFHDAETHALLYYIRYNAPETIGLGIAGGLHASNLDRLRNLLVEFDLSIDAQGKLRDGNDHLDMNAVANYLGKADQLFREYRQAA